MSYILESNDLRTWNFFFMFQFTCNCVVVVYIVKFLCWLSSNYFVHSTVLEVYNDCNRLSKYFVVWSWYYTQWIDIVYNNASYTHINWILWPLLSQGSLVLNECMNRIPNRVSVSLFFCIYCHHTWKFLYIFFISHDQHPFPHKPYRALSTIIWIN